MREVTLPLTLNHRVNNENYLALFKASLNWLDYALLTVMVGVAQLVEHPVVVRDVAGSSPVAHPIF